MKLEVIQEKFAKALTHVSKAVSGKANIPVLNNVLIKTEKGAVRLSATNLEIGINAMVGADVDSEGAVTVSAKLLSEFVNSMKPGKLELSLDGNKFVVKSVDNSAQFFVIPADEFPDTPQIEGEAAIVVPALEFSHALDKTAFAAATDNSRPVLAGLLVKVTQRKMTLVALDSFRLSQKILDVVSGPQEDFREIIPAKSLLEVGRIIKDVSSKKDNVEVFVLKSKNQIIFKIGDIELASRLIEGQYPAYEDVIPSSKEYGFHVLKSDFANTVKIVSIFARNAVSNKTIFRFDPESSKLFLNAEVVDVGKNEVNVDVANIIGEDIETSFNAKFLQDMINVNDGDEIIFETVGPNLPCVFRDSGDENYLHLIMPIVG